MELSVEHCYLTSLKLTGTYKRLKNSNDEMDRIMHFFWMHSAMECELWSVFKKVYLDG